MVSNVESDKARKEELRGHREHDTLRKERKNNEATLTELKGRSFGISHASFIVLIIAQLLPFST